MSLLDRFRQKRPPAPELDLLLVRRLRSVGADLTGPRPIAHFLDFPSEADARAAAEEIDRGGYVVTVAAEENGTWSVRAEGTRVVDESTVTVYRRWFERIAAAHAGEYDGWESSA